MIIFYELARWSSSGVSNRGCGVEECPVDVDDANRLRQSNSVLLPCFVGTDRNCDV